jgi:hypothetical protein
MKIELDSEKEVYRLSDGDDESADYIAGELANFGELAWIEKDGENFFAFIDSDGQTDGQVYLKSSGFTVEVEPDCEFEDDDDTTSSLPV